MVLLTTSLLGCQKESEILPQNAAPITGKTNAQDIGANYPFNWESVLTMPLSANATKDVFVPWRNQGGTPLDPGIVDDYKKQDGWELVYNSFLPDNFPQAGLRGSLPTKDDQPTGGLYFALYNRYRGILRYYMYIPTGYFGSSTQLSHGLQIESTGNTSKMLNFEGQDIVDVTNNVSGFTETSKEGVPATGGWYAMQYQLAYDPAFANTTYPNPGFRWDVNSLSVTQLLLNGVETGTIKGTAVTPQSGFNWANTIVNVGLSALEIVSGFGLASAADGSLQKAINSGVSGSTAGYLSGLFGSSSGGSQTIDLTLNSTIETKGTATTSQLYQANPFAFPGQQIGSNANAPLVSHPLGLFNLSGKPTVQYRYQVERGSYRGAPNYHAYDFFLPDGEIGRLVQFNPSVINSDPTTGATISGLRGEVLLLNPGAIWGVDAFSEQIGTVKAYAGGSLSAESPSMSLGNTGEAVVRVSFRVVPNNGSPSTLIVKTFKANLQRVQ